MAHRVGLNVGRWSLELDLREWVNDGLMAIFFLVVGLEIKRELLLGELRDRRRAALPVIAAVGGMVVPALLFIALNPSGPESDGWGIPMATDIAFAVGVLALVAPSIPSSLRLFLLTLAIVDDIGAILVIAVFYSKSVDITWLAVARCRRRGRDRAATSRVHDDAAVRDPRCLLVARRPRLGRARDDRRRDHGPARARHPRADEGDRSLAR